MLPAPHGGHLPAARVRRGIRPGCRGPCTGVEADHGAHGRRPPARRASSAGSAENRYIRVERESGVAPGGEVVVITMARPERAQRALRGASARAARRVSRSRAGSDARGVILAAEGPVFSAGHDFQDMSGRDLTAMRQLLGVCRDVMTTIQEIPQIVIAQVQGLATAAGCQLVATCDLAVAGRVVQLRGARADAAAGSAPRPALPSPAPSAASTRSRCCSPAIRSTPRPRSTGV